MSTGMLRQYGIAAPSSLTPVLHPEDAQPNERGSKRNQRLPPRISTTSAPRGNSNGFHQRGGYRGRPMYRGGPFTQYAVRGNSSWRERGRGQGSSRGTTRPPIMDQYRQANVATSTSTSSAHSNVHWSRQETGLSLDVPIDVNAGPSTTLNYAQVEASASRREYPTPTLSQSPYLMNPSLPSKPPAEDYYRQRGTTTSANAHSSTQNSASLRSLNEEHSHSMVNEGKPSHMAEPRNAATEPSDVRPTHAPEWLLRSRSPSPKLPLAPLKRRKLGHDYTALAPTPREIKSDLVNETILPHAPAPKAPASVPLPGRQTTAAHSAQRLKTATYVKEEKISPVKVKPEPSPSVKQEYRSPSPTQAIKTDRRLITESTNFYPLPESCKKSDPGFAQNRRGYFQQKNKELLKLGLKKTKAFWRDDGLVIEWSSTLPVWSDTLKPDIPDLATAIQRAHELNNIRTPHRSPKRKRENPAASSAPKNDIASTSEEVHTGADNKTRESPTKKARKHWAHGIPLEELERTTNLAAPSTSQLSQETTTKRLLPTRQHNAKPSSTSPDPPKPFTLPDPTAPIPSQEWRTAANKADVAASRMIFKPINPRKSQGTVQEAHAAASAGTQATARGRQESVNGAESTQPGHSVHSQPERPYPRGTAPTSSAMVHLSRGSTPRDRPTPDSARSLTLVNECLSRNPHVQIASPANDELEFTSSYLCDPVHDLDDRAVDRAEELDLESVALDLLRGTADTDDMSDDDNESLDEETEHNVQQFISKYASMFDSDRRNLKKAYAKDALFSCRVHHAKPNSCASLFIPEGKDSFRSTHSRASASQVIRGRTQICDELLTLGQYQFIPRGVPQNPLYTWTIPRFSGVRDGILLSLHGEVVKTEADPAMDHRLTVDQTFLLRQRTAGDDTDDDDGTDIPGQTVLKNFWPLAVVSHQMTARSIPLLDTEDLQNRLEWFRDILE